MAPSNPRLRLPDTIVAGETFEVRALVTHVMETGNRKDAKGERIPRNIIHTFTAHFEDTLVFKGEFGPGISANPFLAFYLKVPGPGELRVTWEADDGATAVERYAIEVSDPPPPEENP